MKELWWVSLALFTVVFLGFHNCAPVDVDLEDALASAALKPSYLRAKGEVCVPQGYSLHSFYASNLSTVFREGILLPDSDGDGLSDQEEIDRDWNPTDRRGSGKVQDRICLSSSGTGDCQVAHLNCVGKENALGISDCDIEFLGLDRHFDHPTQGVDTDKDGVLDLLEVLRGGFPVISDMSDDPDRDFVINQDEYARGSEIRSHDREMSEAYQIRYQLKKMADSNSCAGQAWGIDIEQIPLLINLEYSDSGNAAQNPGGIDFSHDKDENILLLQYTLKNTDGVGDSFVFTHHFKKKRIEPENGQIYNFDSGQFHKVGEIRP